MIQHYTSSEKIKLSGFNNLTKVLSFNLYDFCITFDEGQKAEYINWIHGQYNAARIAQISRETCEIIDAEILAVSQQDYDPVGASSMVLMSDIAGGGTPLGTTQGCNVKMHLDKSHITAHTYPDAADPAGICTFRVDIDVATCGEIIPLKAVNHLFKSFEADVVVIDYVVRGYTRLESGKKIYNDYRFNSIQEFINNETLKDYEYRVDMNMENVNTWQTKLLVKDFGADRYVLESRDINHPEVDQKMTILKSEMKEVFHMLG